MEVKTQRGKITNKTHSMTPEAERDHSLKRMQTFETMVSETTIFVKPQYF